MLCWRYILFLVVLWKRSRCDGDETRLKMKVQWDMQYINIKQQDNEAADGDIWRGRWRLWWWWWHYKNKNSQFDCATEEGNNEIMPMRTPLRIMVRVAFLFSGPSMTTTIKAFLQDTLVLICFNVGFFFPRIHGMDVIHIDSYDLILSNYI